jgi:methionyl-tRNA formyltransferase
LTTCCFLGFFIAMRCSFLGCGDVFSKPFHDALSQWNILASPGEIADVGVVASHGRILRSSDLSKYKRGVVNMHPSLLPLYRGAAPAEWQILRGERISGVTAILTTTRVDAGPILAQESFPLAGDATRDDLLVQAAGLGVVMLRKILDHWDEAVARAVPQNTSNATTAPKV